MNQLRNNYFNRLSSPRALLAVVLLLQFPILPVAAEDEIWSKGKEHPPVVANNRIIKWCEKNGKGVRYASANIELANYAPCGKLETQSSCDASGSRYFSKSKDLPHGNRDCNVGPRIVIERDGVNLLEQQAEESPSVADANYSQTPEPMTPGEERKFQKEYEKLATDQEKKQQEFVDSIVGLLSGKPNGKGNSKSKSKSGGSQQIEEIVRQLFGGYVP